MRILGIAASPRKNGNSEILLDTVLEGAAMHGAKTEKLVLDELRMRPCTGDMACLKKAVCVIEDDMRPIYEKLKTYDAIVVASPVYFGSITAQLKILIDRCQPIWVENFLLRKARPKKKRKGIFISVSAQDKMKFFRNSEEIVRIFFAVIGVELCKKLYVPDLDEHGEVLAKKEIMNKAFKYGAELAASTRKRM